MDNNNTVSDTTPAPSPMMTNEELIALLQTRDPKAVALFATLSPDEEDIIYFSPIEIVTPIEETDEVIVSIGYAGSEPLNDEDCDEDEEENNCDCDECCTACDKKNNFDIN